MKTPLLLCAAFVASASANIIFNHVPLSCDNTKPHFTGCLRGQDCQLDGT